MIKNCFNYVGSKDRIFSAIDENLDKSKDYLVDVFCGSGVVGVNEASSYSKVVLNDACWQMVETLKYFRDSERETVLSEIDNVINKFSLSKDNKDGYIELRDYYNTNCFDKEHFDPISFYCLLTHSFNYNIHINSSGGFSVPFGSKRSSFNNSLRTKFENFQTELSLNKSKVSIRNLDFEDLIRKADKLINKSMFYLDPPYLSSDSSYSRIHYLGKWDAGKEKRLYSVLDFINSKGGSFLLSNVIENNGRENEVLKEWGSKYNMIEISSDFTNCNYQRKNLGKTREVLIRNY